MGYALNVSLQARLDVSERADATTSPLSTAGGNQRLYDQVSLDQALSSGSFPAVGGQAIDLSWTLAGTTKDFDLTAAPWAGDTSKTVDKTGKKLVAIGLRFDVANNAAGVTFGPQGANGYALFGSGIVPRFYPGDQVLLCTVHPTQAAALAINRPAVAGGAKDLRFTGTAADKWKVILVFDG